MRKWKVIESKARGNTLRSHRPGDLAGCHGRAAYREEYGGTSVEALWPDVAGSSALRCGRERLLDRRDDGEASARVSCQASRSPEAAVLMAEPGAGRGLGGGWSRNDAFARARGYASSRSGRSRISPRGADLQAWDSGGVRKTASSFGDSLASSGSSRCEACARPTRAVSDDVAAFLLGS